MDAEGLRAMRLPLKERVFIVYQTPARLPALAVTRGARGLVP